jgi:hypothetical protein
MSYTLAEKRIAQELRERASELENAVAAAQADAAKGRRAHAQGQRGSAGQSSGRSVHGAAPPLALQLSGLPWVSTSVPSAAWLGPTAGAKLALYQDGIFGQYDLFSTIEARVGAYPGGLATFKTGFGPQGPIFRMPDQAAVQFQPYVGGRADFGWTGSGIAFRPTTTLAAGGEMALSRQVSLELGWSAEYGADWLPYTGLLTTGLQFGW